MQTSVTTKNMVTIPAEVARRLRISPGCRLDWEPVDGSDTQILVRVIPKRSDLARRLLGRGRQYLKPESNPIRELIDERAGEDEGENLT